MQPRKIKAIRELVNFLLLILFELALIRFAQWADRFYERFINI